jgi:aspartyl/glutamyl-tRNA(Asn/Gln) amidotransferase C subunit
MNIEKLEKLSCLKIQDKDRKSMSDSLLGVYEMMSHLDKVVELDNTTSSIGLTSFREEKIVVEKVHEITVDSQEKIDGYFLSPKVIKK